MIQCGHGREYSVPSQKVERQCAHPCPRAPPVKDYEYWWLDPSQPRKALMSLTAIILLALVQGITEFLPISSSGHLILMREFGAAAGLDTVGANANADLVMDVALHVGTLAAVVLYTWKDLRRMSVGVVQGLSGNKTEGWHLAWVTLTIFQNFSIVILDLNHLL